MISKLCIFLTNSNVWVKMRQIILLHWKTAWDFNFVLDDRETSRLTVISFSYSSGVGNLVLKDFFWKTPRFLSLQKIFQSDNENRFISLKYWKIVHLYILVLNRNLVQCFKEKVKLQTHLNLLHLKCGLHYTHHWHHVYSAMTFDFVQFYLNR